MVGVKKWWWIPGLFILVAELAWAGADVELRLGSGPDGYRSREVSAWADIFDWPLIFDARYFLARNPEGRLLEEMSWGLSWQTTEWLLTNVKRKSTRGEAFDIKTNEIGAEFVLSQLWQGERKTRFGVAYAESDYESNAVHPVVFAFVSRLLPKARKFSYSIEQEILPQWSISLGYDDYRYSKDPADVARFLARRLRRPNSSVFELTSFPDHSTSLDVYWSSSEIWSLKLSKARTVTAVQQNLDTLGLEGSYRFNKTFQMGASVTRSTSDTLRRRNGAIIVEGSAGNYFEISGRLSFD